MGDSQWGETVVVREGGNRWEPKVVAIRCLNCCEWTEVEEDTRETEEDFPCPHCHNWFLW